MNLTKLDEIYDFENIIGTNFDDFLTGNSQNNILFGLNGSDIIMGNDGDDIINGGYGKNKLDGGNGLDSISYLWLSSMIEINLCYKSAINIDT